MLGVEPVNVPFTGFSALSVTGSPFLSDQHCESAAIWTGVLYGVWMLVHAIVGGSFCTDSAITSVVWFTPSLIPTVTLSPPVACVPVYVSVGTFGSAIDEAPRVLWLRIV